MYDLSNVCGVDYSHNKWRKKSTKGWEFILYPDSEYYNYNWKKDLEKYHNPYCYILHDKDFYEDDEYYTKDSGEHKKGELKHAKGELKKAHYHVYFWFGNAVKFTQALDVMETCGGCRIQPILNKSGAIRYLTHVDYPDKTQYSIDDVVHGGGLDFKKYYYEGAIDIEPVLDKIHDFLKLNEIWTVNQFLDFTKSYNREWHNLYINKDKVRKYVDNYCKNQGYEVRYFKGEDGTIAINSKRSIKYYKVPKYDIDGNLVLDSFGNIVADKEVLY